MPMLDLNNFFIKKVSEADGYGEFIIGPLPRGYGHTLGNSIRRILLSSLSGAAITSVKIAGVDHEYSVLPGMQDDVLTFILKLKNVVIRSYSDDPVRVKLEVNAKKGETLTVTAGDIQADASIEIINKDYEITTITDGGKLSAELIIEKGRGYRSADLGERGEIGLLPVDAIFSPVEVVRLKIGNARVGHRTDYDQIELHIHTNNAITPTESLKEAFEIYQTVTNRLAELVDGNMNGSEDSTLAEKEGERETELSGSGLLIKDLKLSTRLRNALINSAITDLRVLEGKSKEELLEIRGMGQKSADELTQIMKDNNLTVLE